MENPTIEHQPEEQRFVARVDGHECVLEYRLVPGALDLVHTYTPSAVRGRGIAGKLVRFAFDHVTREGLQVVPTCPYVGDYLARHPEFGHLVVGSR
jgi:predicted GNAT family acetyltransferase